MGESKRTFDITVEGQYYGVHDLTGIAVVKNYTAHFVLPSLEAALSVICKHLLDPYLRKNYPDYARFRSHRITSITTNGKAPDRAVLQMSFDDMTAEQLSDFCILNRIAIDPYEHKDLDKCREDIKTIYQARLAQARADKENGKATGRLKVDKLLEMNALPPEDENVKVSINEQKLFKKTPAAPAQKVEPLKELEAPVEADTPLPPEEPEDILK